MTMNGDEDNTPTSEAIGFMVSSLGILLLIIGVPVAIIAGTIHTSASLAWGLPAIVIPLLMVVGGLVFVPPVRRR